jgi:hypothetical protein
MTLEEIKAAVHAGNRVHWTGDTSVLNRVDAVRLYD